MSGDIKVNGSHTFGSLIKVGESVRFIAQEGGPLAPRKVSCLETWKTMENPYICYVIIMGLCWDYTG